MEIRRSSRMKVNKQRVILKKQSRSKNENLPTENKSIASLVSMDKERRKAGETKPRALTKDVGGSIQGKIESFKNGIDTPTISKNNRFIRKKQPGISSKRSTLKGVNFKGKADYARLSASEKSVLMEEASKELKNDTKKNLLKKGNKKGKFSATGNKADKNTRSTSTKSLDSKGSSFHAIGSVISDLLEKKKSTERYLKQVFSLEVEKYQSNTTTSFADLKNQSIDNQNLRGFKGIIKGIGDSIFNLIMLVISLICPIVIPVILLGMLLIVVLGGILILLSSSIFGIFLVDLSPHDPEITMEVYLKERMIQFESQILDETSNYEGIDSMHVRFEGMSEGADNYDDIIATYFGTSVSCSYSILGDGVVSLDSLYIDGDDNTAELNLKSDENIEKMEAIFSSMNYIDVEIEEQERSSQNEDGSVDNESYTIKYVTVYKKTYNMYGMDAGLNDVDRQSVWVLYELFYSGFEYPGDFEEVDYLTPEQYSQINANLVAGEKGSEVVKLALTQLRVPYSQEKRNQKGFFDCSSFTFFCWKSQGINLSMEGSNVAAAQAKYITEHNLAISEDMLAPGDLIFWSTSNNGRYLNVTHIGIYAGDGMVIDASYGKNQVVYREIFSRESIVLYGRPYVD